MPKGRSKGFGHYMNKKFFHPGNPENLERVFVAREKVKMREKLEKEKLSEYAKEQERWENRAAISTDDKDRISLSFMYDPPAGVRQPEIKQPPDEKDDFKFSWQRNAPRQPHAKNDPNIIDQPFGISVQMVKCIKCHTWGHQHTDKNCPRYGKSSDHEEPARVINEKELIHQMKDSDKLQFTSYGAWDNGKAAKEYDLVYDETSTPHSDIMLQLLQDMRSKEEKVKKLRKKVMKASSKKSSKKKKKKASSSTPTKRKSSKNKSKRKETKKSSSKTTPSTSKYHEISPKRTKLDPHSDFSDVSSDHFSEGRDTDYSSEDSECISESSNSSEDSYRDRERSREAREEYLSKLDHILFSQISTSKGGSTSPSTSRSSGNKSTNGPKSGQICDKDDLEYLSKVDQILGLDQSNQPEEDKQLDKQIDKELDKVVDKEDEEGLSETDMRLFNLISINKIDVKNNFPQEYHGDVTCHFCRTVESTEHLAECPVYDDIMQGTEFKNIHSKKMRKVKRALDNIRQALHKRSKALSVTSVGSISANNMKLLDTTATAEDADLEIKRRKVLHILDSQRFNIC